MKSGSFFLIIVLALIIYSCKEKEDIYPDWGTDVECQPAIQFKDTVRLSDKSLEYIEFWKNQAIIYKNEDGEEMRFDNSSGINRSFFSGFIQEKCKGLFPNRFFVPMESTFCTYQGYYFNMNLSANVTLSPSLESFYVVDINSAVISSSNFQQPFQLFVNLPTSFQGITEQEYLNTNANITPYVSLDSITFYGKKYFNVLKMNITWQNNAEMYISKEHGVLAFKDDKNVLWVWNRFIN